MKITVITITSREKKIIGNASEKSDERRKYQIQIKKTKKEEEREK